jgi:hypothetical protein
VVGLKVQKIKRSDLFTHILLIFLALCFIVGINGCIPSREEKKTNIKRYILTDNCFELEYFIVKIDGCEYIYLHNKEILVHKGNCKNHTGL